MGQRLVVTIEKNEKPLAKIYYHWSAYTGSALYETKKIIDCIYNHQDETENELLLRLIRFCESNGGGIRGSEDASEYNYIKAMFPNETFKTEGYSRNDGLIALSDKGMADLQDWSEGDVLIDLDTETVEFCVYAGYNNWEEYVEERKSWDETFDETQHDIPTFDFSLGYFNVQDIYKIAHCLENVSGYVAICNGEICEFIA